MLAVCAVLALGDPMAQDEWSGFGSARKELYQLLVSGSDLSQWVGYGRVSLPKAWSAKDGVLACNPGNDGGDIRTRAEYGDFDLQFEWKVEPNGNSGVMYRAAEGAKAVWHTAVEYQIFDDKDGKADKYSAGAAYDLFAPTKFVTKKAGEWNSGRIVAKGDHVEHWLNGVKVVSFSYGSEPWKKAHGVSKFTKYPGFATTKRGYLAVQDHGHKVWYRNLRIREL